MTALFDKKGKRVVFGILCGCVTVIIAAVVLTALVAAPDAQQDEMLEVALEWGRLAPLPETATGFKISTEGGMFTREYRTIFYLPEDDLAAWIAASPGLQDAQIQTAEDSSQKYTIKPGGGAQYAEAVIDFDFGRVQIYTYWS